MNLREINKQKYEDALKAYQEQIVEIAILEYELKNLGDKKGNASKEFFTLKERISQEYEELAVLAQAVTDTFKAFQDEEEIVAEEVNLGSLENQVFSDRYYEILDRYEDQLEHIEHLEKELVELGERKGNASEEEFLAKRKEIDAAYDALAILAADLNKEVEPDYKEFTLEDLKNEIDETINAVKEDEILTEEDKQIISELEVEEIERLQAEIEQYKIDLIANVKRKGELLKKDNAKQENLIGFDEAIRQLQEKIKIAQEELRYYLAKHPELEQKNEEPEKVKDVHTTGFGFEELSRYIEGYLFMKSTGEEKVHTDVETPYEDQKNISITLNLGSGYTYHYNDARNPETGESYGYICWIAHKKDSTYITPEEFAEGADKWSNECDHVFQFRGDRRTGIQIQELKLQKDGKLYPTYVYETHKDKILKAVVGENSLKEVSISTMLIEIDENLNSVIKEESKVETEEKNEENFGETEFEYDKLEIERLESQNKELIRYRNENEKRKLLLMEKDDAKPENLKGYDEAIRQINEEIKQNEALIASIKSKYPHIYREEAFEIIPQEEERATEEEIKEAIEEALANVEASKEEDEVEAVLGLLNKEEIENIIDKKLNEIYGKDTVEERVDIEEIKEEIDKELENVILEEQQIKPDEIESVIEEEMNAVDVELPVDYEEIFEGTFVVEEYLTAEEQKEKVFYLMEKSGVKITEDEKRVLVISYEGTEDGKTTKFVVKKPIEKVPYVEPNYEQDYKYPPENTNDATEQSQKETIEEEPKQEPKPEDEKEYIRTMTPNGVQLVEKITLYVDIDNSEVYGKNYLFRRFNMNKTSDEVRIDGFACYKMDNDYVEYIIRNQNNNYSPYVVETREVRMGKKEVVEEVIEEKKVDEKTIELANEISIAERYMLILHPEYKDINKLDQEEQRNLLIDYWYIRDNYKDIDNLFNKMKKYYSGADIDDKSLLISILPKYVVEQEMSRRKERGEELISEQEYKEAVYKALANKDRYMPDWSYTETMLQEISSVNTKHAIMMQKGEINKDFHVDKPEIIKPQNKEKIYHNEIDTLENLRNRINEVLVNYQKGLLTVDEAINELAKIFQENTTAINYSLETVSEKDKVRNALMNIINDRNKLYEMCGIIVGELTDNNQIQYLNLEDAYRIMNIDNEVYEDLTTYLMSTLLIQQTESQIIVDSKVVDYMKGNSKVR